MKLLMMIVTIWVSMETTNSLPYRIFGTKRYRDWTAPRPIEMAEPYIRASDKKNDYLESNPYLYYESQQPRYYGMPVYLGEYQPKAYFYATPRYNFYSEDRRVSNPLDDLHEEILQENEQERQSDLINDASLYDDYYVEPSQSQRDAYTNNFLRNMIDYNREKEKHQLLEKFRHQQAEQQQQQQQQQQQLQQQKEEEIEPEDEHFSDDDYLSELEMNPDEYQYEPKGDSNFDVQKYWESEMSSLANSVTSTTPRHQWETTSAAKNDEDVQELKSLTKQHDSYDDDEEDSSKHRFHAKPNEDHHIFSNSWEHDSDLNSPYHNEHDDDYSSFDYDDGSWINWDRKRSSLQTRNRILNTDKFKNDFKVRKRLSTKKDMDKNSSLRSTVTSAKTPEAPTTKTLGQKEKLFAAEDKTVKPAAGVLENRFTAGKVHSKSPAVDQSIYNTIKQMINIEQELKKTGSKKRKRFVSDEGSLVSQLDSLRRIKN